MGPMRRLDVRTLSLSWVEKNQLWQLFDTGIIGNNENGDQPRWPDSLGEPLRKTCDDMSLLGNRLNLKEVVKTIRSATKIHICCLLC